MRRLLLSMLAVLALGVTAHAADLGVAPLYKAPPAAYVSGCAGCYWGVGTSAAVAQSSLSSSSLFATSLANGNLTADGGSVDFEVGWLGKIGNYPAHLAVTGSYQNISGGLGGASLDSRWAITEHAAFNVELVQMLASATGVSLPNYFSTIVPVAPPNVSGIPTQYIGGILREAGLQGKFGSVTGETVVIAPGVESQWIWQTVNSAGVKNGGAVNVWAQADWPMKGLEVNGVFASSGPPMLVSGGAAIGTEYRAGITLYLPPPTGL